MARKRKHSAEAVARRRVRAANKPTFNAINRAGDQAKSDLEFGQGQVANIYDALSQVLDPLQGDYNEQMRKIQESYQQGAASAGGFTPSIAPGVAQASNAARGEIGLGGIDMIQGNAARTNDWLTRMKEVGGLAEKDTRLSMLQGYQDFVRELKNRKLDLRGQMGADRLALVDQIIESHKDRALKERELDIAEDQFGKTFGLQKSQVRHDNRSERRAQNTTERFLTDEGQDKAARKRLKRVNPKLASVGARLNTLQDAPPGTQSAASPLINRLERKQTKLKRKRRRARKELND